MQVGAQVMLLVNLDLENGQSKASKIYVFYLVKLLKAVVA